jgi:hypothetical protein
MAVSSNSSQSRSVSFDTEDEIISPHQADTSDGENQLTPFGLDTPSIPEEQSIAEDASAADDTDLEEQVELFPDPTERSEDICAINDDLNAADKVQSVGGASLVDVNGFRWNNGGLQLRFHMDTDESQWIDFRDAKIDYPRQTATYISSNYKSRSSRPGTDRVLSWANRTLRNLKRAIRRVVHLYDFFLNDNDDVKLVRRAVRAKKKKAGLGPRGKIFKFGIQVPQTAKEAIDIDTANGNTLWQDAMRAEMDALEKLDCFEFHPEGCIPGDDYQPTRLRMIFDVKADTLQRKARLVAGGHLVDTLGADVYSSTVKSISVKLLHVIAHSTKMEALCGDIGNAFVTAFTQEKVYCIAGPEFLIVRV